MKSSAILDALRKQTAEALGKYLNLERVINTDKPCDAELREINRELGSAGDFIKSLYENLVSGIITQDEFTELKRGYEAKNEALSARADEIRSQNSKAHADRDAHYGYADAVSEAVCELELTAEIVDAVVEKILVQHDKTFEVFYRFDDKREAS